jgi:putative hemolysin
MKESGNKKHLDLKSILKDTDSTFLRKLPGFVISIVAAIICQKRINYIINKYEDYIGVDFLQKIIEELKLNVEIEGLEHLPENGKCFFLGNHVYGFLDGLIMANTVGQKYGRLKAIGNDNFNYVPNLRPLIAFVNVYGRTPKDYINALNEVYDSDSPVNHFPSGTVSRKIDGKIQDFEWQKSVIAKAVSCHRDIVPFHFYGRNSRLFYFIYTTRKRLGIDMNFELMLLPRELFRKEGSTVKVRIGKPIPWQTFDKTYSQKDWAEKLRQHVYKLGEAPSAELDFNNQ